MNDRFKFRVWNKSLEKYVNNINISPFGLLVFIGSVFCFIDNNYVVEQCTGLKDKNGNLIYESDYVKANDVIYRVFWNKTKISLANILNGHIIDMSETITMEIVGNEHEKDNISEIPKNTERRFN